MKNFAVLSFLCISINLCGSQPLYGYPLDGEPYSRISRLEGYYRALQTPSGRDNLSEGALLSLDQAAPSCLNCPEHIPQVDPSLQRELLDILGRYKRDISISLLDITRPESLRYAEHNAVNQFLPGSVGKVLVALAIFNELSLRYPNNLEKRRQLLRSRLLSADEIINSDSHEVPFWLPEKREVLLRPLVLGDTANLWTYLDWMLSASSNAAASMLMKEAVLFRHFQSRYPPTASQEAKFFAAGNKSKLASLLSSSMSASVTAAGLNAQNTA